MLVTITPRHGIFVTKWGKITVFIESLIVDFSFSIFYLSFYEFFSIFLNFLTYCQMHRTGKYSQHSLINHLASLANGLVFVYELSGCGFESSWSHVNFRYHACFDQGVSCYSGNYRLWIHSEKRTWYDNIQSNAPYR